jgi:hypothetical protein
VSVLAAPFAAGHAVQTFPAGMRIGAAMLPFEPLKLKHDPGHVGVKIEELPAQPERFTLP